MADFEPPFCAAGVLMRPNDRRVDDQAFKVWIIGQPIHDAQGFLPKESLESNFHPKGNSQDSTAPRARQLDFRWHWLRGG